MLGGVLADAGAVAAEGFFNGLGFLGVADGDVDQAYRFVFCCAGGAGDAGDAEAEGCAGAETDAGGEGFGYLGGDGAVLGDELGVTPANAYLSESE